MLGRDLADFTMWTRRRLQSPRAGSTRLTPIAAVGILALCLFAPVTMSATSVRSVSVGEMAARSQLIFEGRVVAVEARNGSAPGSILTCVLFEVLDRIKGADGSNTIELCFGGGTMNGRTRWVSGMSYPEPGESGIYFIEDPERPLVNPVFGWDQGRFPIRTLPETGEAQVTVADGAPVVGLGHGDPGAAARRSNGVAIGVEIDPRNAVEPADAQQEQALRRAPSTAAPEQPPVREPMSPQAFKAIVRSMIDEEPR